jgi:fluoride exporter
MFIYFWIALGGAVGSVGRYWMGLRVPAPTELAFPWGTIVINILGSLVIGFLATFTGSDGRMPAPLDIRAF